MAEDRTEELKDYMQDFTFEDWEKYWREDQADWNKSFVDPILKKNFPILLEKLEATDKKLRILLPLCGKTPDLIWLAELGHDVVGVEYVEQGVKEFFADNKLEYKTEVFGEMRHHKCVSDNLKLSIWQGDFYQCTSDLIGQFDIVWDHGSFTAINTGDREKFIDVLLKLLRPDAAILMSSICMKDEYEVPIEELFSKHCNVELLEFLDSLYGPDHKGDDLIHSPDQGDLQRYIYLIRIKK